MLPILSLLILSFATSPSFAADSRKSCVVPHGDDNSDDSPAIMKVFQECNTNSNIIFSPGVKYNAWSPMYWKDLQNVVIWLKGSLHLPKDIDEVQAKVRSNKNPGSSNKPWFYIEGTNVFLIGGKGDDSGAFYGYGESWWAATQKINRPRLAAFHVTNGGVTDIKSIKPIAWGISVSGRNVVVKNHFVDAAPDGVQPGNRTSFPSNTDGIAISGTNVVVDGYYGHNGDDCINITNGGRNIVAKNGYCGFSSHGLSIGSLGQDGETANVFNVTFQNWTMENADYAARFKSWIGGQGQAESVTWKDIQAINVTTGIFVTQHYFDAGKVSGSSSSATSSTKVKNFVFENIKGYLAPKKKNGEYITDSIILELFEGDVEGLSFKNIDIRSYTKEKDSATVVCDPSVFTTQDRDNLGFTCKNGGFKATK